MMKDVCSADPQCTIHFSDVFHFVHTLPFHKYFLIYIGINIYIYLAVFRTCNSIALILIHSPLSDIKVLQWLSTSFGRENSCFN